MAMECQAAFMGFHGTRTHFFTCNLSKVLIGWRVSGNDGVGKWCKQRD